MSVTCYVQSGDQGENSKATFLCDLAIVLQRWHLMNKERLAWTSAYCLIENITGASFYSANILADGHK